jgi:hypothetical protein
MKQEKSERQYMHVCDARYSESKALPVAQFVNAAYDTKP